MRRSWIGSFGTVLLVLAALPAAAGAQRPGPEPGQRSGRRCNQVLPADARQLVNAAGQQMVYFRDPVRMVCANGLVIEADSAIFNRSEGSMQLVGQVVYRDSTRQLTADWANYLGGSDVLFARGDVVLRELGRGSRVDGDELEFRRETDTRPQSLMIVRGRRPHALIPPSRGPAPGTRREPPIEVWGNRLQFEGETLFRAQGNAELRRGNMTGAADSARFDQLAHQVTLTGHGHVENEQYRLEGDRIDAFLPGDTLREVEAEGSTRLISSDLRVTSDRLRIALVGGQLERLEAWNPDGLAAFRPPAAPPAADSADAADAEPAADTPSRAPADTGRAAREPSMRQPEGRGEAPTVASTEDPTPVPAGARSPGDSVPPPGRARAVARGFTLRADSIDARADSGQVREVRAVSRAFGVREADSLGVGLPGLVARDWIQGDTIIGYFAADTTVAGPADGAGGAPDGAVVAAPQDSAPASAAEPAGEPAGEPAAALAGEPVGDAPRDSAEVVLERIVVIGGSAPALSLYRLAPERPGSAPALNFMKAQRITLHLTAGELERVDAAGPIEGIYLDPAAARGGGETEPPAEEAGG